MFDRLLARVRGLLTRDRARRELDEELRHHLEMETRANIERGLSAQEARRRALIELGGVEQVRERVHDVRALWFDALVQDIRFAFRRFGRERAFTATAVFAVGLTVGLATTIFSVTHAVLLRPLPYAEPDRLVLVGPGDPEDVKPQEMADNEYHYWLERARVFEGMAGAAYWDVELIAGIGTEELNGQRITASLLPLLGIKPILGRAFVPDDELPGRGRVILLSERLWRTSFGEDPSVVAAQVALVVVLVSAAGLTLKSLWRMTGTDLGFDPRHVLTVKLLFPPDIGPASPRRLAFDKALLFQVRSMPGVWKASTTTDLPFPSGGITGLQLTPGERPRWAEVFVVDPEYLSLIGLRPISGRMLSGGDDHRSTRVAIINQTLADKHFPGVNPLGQRIIIKYTYEVVGMVASHREMVRRPDQDAGIRAIVLRKDEGGPMVSALSPPAVYLPSAQADWSWLTYLVVRSTSDPRALVPRLRRTIATLVPTVSVREAATFDEWMGLTSDAPRFYATVLGSFSLAALLLAAVGIYGVLAQTVGQRVHEIGVRMALGARAGSVAWLVLSRAVTVVGLGLVLGLGGAAAVTRTFRVFLFEVSPTDPATLASATVVLVIVAAIAAWVPTRRATRVDPLTALRCE